jgi:multiple inositol-polyphosphate phosphatase / 2,3-bisphosphoglycerate 3-phosphatase
MRLFNFLFVCLLTQADVFGQTYLGTKTPYVPSHEAYTAAPAGYQPVFINYVGRHGARFLTKAGADQQVLETLQAAEKSNALTDMGKKIKAIAQRLQAAGKGNYENITLLGQEEQEAIGERMHYSYPNVFAGKGVEVVTTWKVRTQQSAEAFLKGLAGYKGEKKYERAPDSADSTLRFYDLSPAYAHYKKNGLIKKCLDSLDRDGRTLATVRRICGRVFTATYVKELMKTSKGAAFADDLYDLYAIAWSSEGLGIAFDRDDLEWMDFRNGAADFLEKGPGFDSVGIQVKVAAPLLADLINSLDRAIGKSDVDAVLRFTHAEAIAPLAALLGIREASTPVESIYKYHDHWDAGKVIPLSANIQWVLYAGSGDYLVKVLLNEREAVLPVSTSQWPYYRWEDLRAYYVQKLGAFGAGLQQDMLGYLKGLE